MRFSTKYWAGLLLLTLGLAWIFLSPRFSPLSQSAPPDSSRLFELGDHWQHEIELTHAADRYDCIESASKQLACTLVRHLQATSLLDQEPPSISLRCDDQQLPTDVRARLFSSLQSHLQQALLEIGHTRSVQLIANSTTTSDQAESAEPILEIRLTAPSEFSTSDSPTTPGCLVIAGSIHGEKHSAIIPPLHIDEKAWIGNWSDFRENANHRHLCQFRGETLHEAQLLAAQSLVDQWQGGKYLGTMAGLGQDQATELICRQFPKLEMQVDQFEQTFQLTLEDGSQIPALTRCAILVDFSPQKLTAAHRLLDVQNRRQVAHVWQRFGLFSFSVGVLAIMAMGLDRLTLGYYSWRIRSGAVVVASVILLLLK